MLKITTPQELIIQNNSKLPFFQDAVQAGFPSPAEDKIERKLNLDQLLVSHPSSTYFVKVQGNSMRDDNKASGIFSEDILIVDKALEPKPGDIVVAYLDGEFTVKNLGRIDGKYFLLASNPKYPPIPIFDSTEIWGVVTYIIHRA